MVLSVREILVHNYYGQILAIILIECLEASYTVQYGSSMLSCLSQLHSRACLYSVLQQYYLAASKMAALWDIVGILYFQMLLLIV